MRSVRLIVFTLVILLPWVSVRSGQAQDASPAAAAWMDPALDLAAMPVTPGQFAALGHPGYGRFANGYAFPPEHFLDNVVWFYKQPLADVHAALDPMGLVRGYVSTMGLPTTAGDHESPARRGAYMTVIEFTNLEAADAFHTFIRQAAANPEVDFTLTPAPFAIGDEALITSYTSPEPTDGETSYELALIMRSGNVIIDAGLWAQAPVEEAAPAAAPAAAGDLHSPAGSVEELEAIGRRALANIAAVRAGSAPNLPALLLRLGDNPLEAASNYTEGYRLLNGDVLPYYAGRDDDLIADPAMLTGATAAYELEEMFQSGEDEGPHDVYFLTRLFAFPDAGAAHAFMASRPDALAAGGFAKTADAAPGAEQTLLPGEVTDLGDESLAFSFVRAFTDAERQYTGHEVYVRVGATVAALSLEAPPDVPLQVVADIAAAQAACLEAGACSAALPVPDVILAASMAMPVSGTPVD